MTRWLIGSGIALLAVAAVWAVTRGTRGGAEIEYRYAPVEKGDLLLSTSSTGVLVPLTRVDVKSKAGGKIVALAVEEGTVVKEGDVIARIDPEDTRTVFEQARADQTSALARVDQARVNAQLEVQNAEIRVKDAEIALQQARYRLAKAEETTRAQPDLSRAELRSAEAALANAQETMRQLRDVTLPQQRRDAEGQQRRAQADLRAATDDLDRQRRLLEKGYVAQSVVDQAESRLASAQASADLADERLRTIDASLDSQLKAQEARVRQAEESLRQARANQNRLVVTARDLDEAKAAVAAAEVGLRQAQTQRMNVKVRQSDVQSASASAVRSRVSVENAQKQLSDTTVRAPRAGVVTTKYLEEGTIIPPGTSTFAQGTSIVQISDTTTMFVECNVDETDIGSVRPGQEVKIVVEAYPGQEFRGVVRRIFPAAETQNALTTVKVRVEVTQSPTGAASGGGRPGGQSAGQPQAPTQAQGARPGGRRGSGGQAVLKPGMNATCEFIQLEKKEVLILPQQAVRREDGKTFVLVKSSDPMKPEKREVKLGDSGNEGIEVVEGLKEGEEVVIAEIDLAALRDRQNRMMQAEQGGGFGSTRQGGPSQSRASGAAGGGGTGGARSGAAGGGR
jgi:HlyD family secretion protein